MRRGYHSRHSDCFRTFTVYPGYSNQNISTRLCSSRFKASLSLFCSECSLNLLCLHFLPEPLARLCFHGCLSLSLHSFLQIANTIVLKFFLSTYYSHLRFSNDLPLALGLNHKYNTKITSFSCLCLFFAFLLDILLLWVPGSRPPAELIQTL